MLTTYWLLEVGLQRAECIDNNEVCLCHQRCSRSMLEDYESDLAEAIPAFHNEAILLEEVAVAAVAGQPRSGGGTSRAAPAATRATYLHSEPCACQGFEYAQFDAYCEEHALLLNRIAAQEGIGTRRQYLQTHTFGQMTVMSLVPPMRLLAAANHMHMPHPLYPYEPPNSRCHACSRKGGAHLSVCSKCQIRSYCSRQCQAADWSAVRALVSGMWPKVQQCGGLSP